MSKQTPQLLKGFRDFGPEKMPARLFMFEKIRRAFERFGFEPMETPALEYAETLTGKYGAEEKLMYRFRDAGKRDVALRYDLTVPLARFYAANQNALPRPFKRYCISPVWRAESPQKGRFREFYQCDVDCVGTSAAVADAEVIAATAAALKELGIEDIAVKINNRKIIDGVLQFLGVQEQKWIAAIRELDKLDKTPQASVEKQLGLIGLEKTQIKKLFAKISASATDGKGLQDIFSEDVTENKNLAEGVGELSNVLDALGSLGIKNIVVDLKLARGLDYYTSTVCEIILSEQPEFGSIAGGGRYDNLIGAMAGGKQSVPAVGMSIGIDRLIAALEDASLIKYDVIGDCLVFNLDQKLLDAYLKIAGELRACGINADFYYQADDLDKQFKYAEKKKINLGIFIGEEEVKKGEVTLKDLVTRKQWKIKAEKMIEEVQKVLSQP